MTVMVMVMMIFSTQAKESERTVAATLSSVSKSVVANTSASSSLLPGGVPVRGEEVAGPPASEESHSPFNYRAPMDNIVIRTFQFPMR